MYNRYLDPVATPAAGPAAGYTEESVPPRRMEPGPQSAPPPPVQGGQNRPGGRSNLLGEVTGGVSEVLGGILKNLSLENFDTGDILLILIILFLFLEGDNLEIVITLGLMLLLGLGDN